jgi:hypothetical protein
MNHFHLHDIVNEIAVVEEGIAAGKDPKEVAKEHITAKDMTLEKVLDERRVQYKDYEPDLGHYGRDGYLFKVPRTPVYTDVPMFDADAAIARTHLTGYHESQRFLKSHIQVPAGILLRSLKFTDDYLDIEDFEDGDEANLDPALLDMKTYDPNAPSGVHAVSYDKDYFPTKEALQTFRRMEQLDEEDRRILELLNEDTPSQESEATL